MSYSYRFLHSLGISCILRALSVACVTHTHITWMAQIRVPLGVL